MRSNPDPFDPFKVVRQFEAALCEYTDAPYAVTTTSCTMALLLACAYVMVDEVEIPNRTYIGVPMSIVHAGGRPRFSPDNWRGAYELGTTGIWDCARRFTSGMYEPGTMQCVSFHWSKILGIGMGGAILHDDPEADRILRQMRFDGRSERVPANVDEARVLGWHAYMTPELAAAGLVRLSLLPEHNDDLPNSDYPDLAEMEIWQEIERRRSRR